MPLNRNAVDKAAGEHIRQLQDHGNVTAEQKSDIRQQHERIAQKVAHERPSKPPTVGPLPKPVRRELGRFRIR